MATDYANLVPRDVADQVIGDVVRQSAALALGRRVPLPRGVTAFPVQSVAPTAAFVNRQGGRSPYTTIEWSASSVQAEPVTATVGIPNTFINETGFPVWDSIRESLANAVAIAIDNAVLRGVGAPTSFPAGGVEAVAGAAVVPSLAGSEDFLDSINAGMAAVEATGVDVSGFAAPTRTKSLLRGLRGTDGTLLYGSPAGDTPGTIHGVPMYSTLALNAETYDLIAGAWRFLVLGYGSDLEYRLSDSAVLQDGVGDIAANMFQDDMTALKVTMRIGAAIGQPVNAGGTTIAPFAAIEATPA